MSKNPTQADRQGPLRQALIRQLSARAKVQRYSGPASGGEPLRSGFRFLNPFVNQIVDHGGTPR